MTHEPNAQPQWLKPRWPAPVNVQALCTLRHGGVSEGPYSSLNLATHVSDDPVAVARNRLLLREAAQLPVEPSWLNQVHGIQVWEGVTQSPPTADASVARETNQICAILTADCLPVLFCDLDGTTVGSAHAGWRGLVGGVLNATLEAMRVPAARVIAWLGPAIEQAAFEVGDEVREQFVARSAEHAGSFAANSRGRWQADLYALARKELQLSGVTSIHGGGFECYADAQRFFSYRRQAQTGRMATMVWLR